MKSTKLLIKVYKSNSQKETLSFSFNDDEEEEEDNEEEDDVVKIDRDEHVKNKVDIESPYQPLVKKRFGYCCIYIRYYYIRYCYIHRVMHICVTLWLK